MRRWRPCSSTGCASAPSTGSGWPCHGCGGKLRRLDCLSRKMSHYEPYLSRWTLVIDGQPLSTPRGELLPVRQGGAPRSEEHTSDSSHSQISYAVFCLKKKKKKRNKKHVTVYYIISQHRLAERAQTCNL